VLRECGVDPGPVLARAGLDERLFESAENRVSFGVMARLVHEAIAATDCPHFGLLLGRRFSPATMGAVFQLMKHSGSLRDALRALVLHLHVHDRGGVGFVVHPCPGEVGVVYGIYHRGGIDVAPLYDVAIAVVFSALRDLCGLRWQPLRITFPHRRPANLAPYRRLFGAPLIFDAEHASVVFADHWLDEPLQGADPAVQAAIEQLIREKEAAEGAGIHGQGPPRAALDGAHRDCHRGPGVLHVRDEPPHAASGTGGRGHEPAPARYRDPLRGRPAAAERVRHARGRDCRGAALRRLECVLAGV